MPLTKTDTEAVEVRKQFVSFQAAKKLSRVVQVIETGVGTIVELQDESIHVIRTNEDLDRLVEVLKK